MKPRITVGDQHNREESSSCGFGKSWLRGAKEKRTIIKEVVGSFDGRSDLEMTLMFREQG